jgi:hypothetical protein
MAADGTADEGWGMKRVAMHFRTRTGVVHLCILAVVAALYVMMRKLSDGDPSRTDRDLDGGAP